MPICPLLSIITMKSEIDDAKQEFVQCQEEKCMWYLRKHGKIEVYDCAISALAVYSLPHHRGDR